MQFNDDQTTYRRTVKWPKTFTIQIKKKKCFLNWTISSIRHRVRIKPHKPNRRSINSTHTHNQNHNDNNIRDKRHYLIDANIRIRMIMIVEDEHCNGQLRPLTVNK